MSLKFVTLNVNGMGDNSKRNAVFHWCRKRNFDVICLQEHTALIIKKLNGKGNGAEQVSGITERPPNEG